MRDRARRFIFRALSVVAATWLFSVAYGICFLFFVVFYMELMTPDFGRLGLVVFVRYFKSAFLPVAALTVLSVVVFAVSDRLASR